MSREETPIRIGTRGSQLARTQTEWAVSTLRAAHPHLQFRTVIIETTGDKQADIPYAAVGTKGMFVKEIEQALADNQIDVGVHSLKDMPGMLPAGLTISCVPVREDALDAFISQSVTCIDDLAEGATIGTSSARRRSQITAYRKGLNIAELRGNVDTRLRKLMEGQYDAIIIASAGLNRLGLSHLITEHLSQEICLPAVGQGALALELRTDDAYTAEIVAAIHDRDSADCVMAERALLEALGGGCSVPVAGYAHLNTDQIELSALVASVDGSTIIKAYTTGDRSRADQIGAEAASILFEKGAEALLRDAAN